MIDVAKMVEMFDEAETASADARTQSFRCRDYVDGKQLTDNEAATLKKRGQPPIVINKVVEIIETLVGLEIQSRTDPKAFPREPNHAEGAEAATDAIRFVADNVDYDVIKSSVWEDMLVEGTGGVEVIHHFQPPMREPEIRINRYPFDRLFWDPHSREHDFSDARYKGAVIWSDIAELKEQYPNKIKDIEAMTAAENDDSGTDFDDRPANQGWITRKRVRVCLIYFKEGQKWKWAKFVKSTILEEGESIYIEDGGSVCPLIFQSAYVDRENNRYGFASRLLDLQDEVNKRRSKSLHLLTSNLSTGEKGAVKSVADVKRQKASGDGHIEYMPGMQFDFVDQTALAAGHASLLAEATAELDGMGANQALSGGEQGQQSGRAIMAKMQGGMTKLTPLRDRLSHFNRAVYRAIWARVRQFWTEEKWIRVTDDEKNVRFVGLNKQITLKDELSQIPPEQAMAFVQQHGLYRGDPRLEQVARVENKVEEIDVDILIEEVPDQVTLAGETFEQLVNLATSGAVPVPPELLVESMPSVKRDVKDKLLEAMEQQQQAASQQSQAEGQVAQAETQSEIEANKAKAAKDMATAMKTQMEAQQPQFY